MLKGEECENLSTTVIKILPTACDNKSRKSIPPKPPAKPKKQQAALSSIKPVVIKPTLQVLRPNYCKQAPANALFMS